MTCIGTKGGSRFQGRRRVGSAGRNMRGWVPGLRAGSGGKAWKEVNGGSSSAAVDSRGSGPRIGVVCADAPRRPPVAFSSDQ